MKKILNRDLNRLTTNEFKVREKAPFVVVLDNIRSLNNIGSVFRSSDAFLIEAIHLCGITATPPHKDIHKTALGATDSVEWKYFETTEDSIAELKKDGYSIYAIEQVQNSIMLDDFSVKLDNKYALVFGNEVKGVQQSIVDVCDGYIEIPQFGTKHSLNISVSAGVVIWDLFSKWKSL